MPTYILFSLLSAFLFSSLTIVQKLTLNKTVKNPLAFNFFLNLGCLIPAISIWFFVPFQFSSEYISSLVLSGSFYFCGNLLLFYGMSKIDASVTGSLFPLKMIFIPILAFFLLQESFSQSIYLWIAIAIIGAFFSSYNQKYKFASFISLGTILILGALLFFSFGDIFARKAIVGMGSWNFQAWLFIILALESLVLIPFIKRELSIKKKVLQIIPVNVILFFLAVFTTNIAFETNVTIPNIIINIGRVPMVLIMAIILSYYLPKLVEHNPAKVYSIRIIGCIIITIAILQIILGL